MIIDKELEKKERIIQTYLIVFSLFLSYGQESGLQIVAMKCFLVFLISAIGYYAIIANYRSIIKKHSEKRVQFLINLWAILCSLIFSYTVVKYVSIITGDNGLIIFLIEFCVLTLSTWWSLFISNTLVKEEGLDEPLFGM